MLVIYHNIALTSNNVISFSYISPICSVIGPVWYRKLDQDNLKFVSNLKKKLVYNVHVSNDFSLCNDVVTYINRGSRGAVLPVFRQTTD